MKLHLFYYDCKSCGHRTKLPELFGSTYGEFLLKTKSGKIAYLNALSSDVFKEFSDLLNHNEKIVKLSPAKRAKILHKVFYIACDLADDGSTFHISQKPDCEHCGENNVGCWGPTEPAEIVELEVMDIKHQAWSALTKKAKETLIDRAISELEAVY